MSAGMLDIVTGLALIPISKPGFWSTGGTSRTLNMTFLRAAAEGEMLVCECEVVHAGQRLCLIQAVLRRERDGAVVSTCEHQKFNNDPGVAKA
jgi:acyl-coenzyme A thioesterase 13